MKKFLYTLMGICFIAGASDIYAVGKVSDKAKAAAKKCVTLIQTVAKAILRNPSQFPKLQAKMCKKADAFSGSFSLRSFDGMFGSVPEGALGEIACKGFKGYNGSSLQKNLLQTFSVENLKDLDAAITSYLKEEKEKDSNVYKLVVDLIKGNKAAAADWKNLIKEESPVEEVAAEAEDLEKPVKGKGKQKAQEPEEEEGEEE